MPSAHSSPQPAEGRSLAPAQKACCQGQAYAASRQCVLQRESADVRQSSPQLFALESHLGERLTYEIHEAIRVAEQGRGKPKTLVADVLAQALHLALVIHDPTWSLASQGRDADVHPRGNNQIRLAQHTLDGSGTGRNEGPDAIWFVPQPWLRLSRSHSDCPGDRAAPRGTRGPSRQRDGPAGDDMSRLPLSMVPRDRLGDKLGANATTERPDARAFSIHSMSARSPSSSIEARFSRNARSAPASTGRPKASLARTREMGSRATILTLPSRLRANSWAKGAGRSRFRAGNYRSPHPQSRG